MDAPFGQEPETVGTRQTVASYATYSEAQRAMDDLADQRFPVQRAAIVAEGLRFVEQVTGRLNYGRAALNGAGSGAIIGIIIGIIFGFLSLTVFFLSFIIYGLIAGAIIGAIIGLIAHALSGGRRDFSSVGKMQAERYNVMVDSEVVNEARKLLGML
jgi:hypothetical protein